MANIQAIRSNIGKMIKQGAPESDIDAYIDSEGVTLDQVRAGRMSGGGILRQFGYGANKEIANLIDAPGNIAAAIVNKPADYVAKQITGLLGFPPSGETAPTRPSYVARQLLDSPPPVTRGERIARRAGQEMGASLPYAAMPYAAAAQKTVPAVRPFVAAPRTVTGTRPTGAVQSLLQGVRATPGKAGVGELVATTGAGIGGGVAQEVAPGNMTAEMVGQLAGGVTPAMLKTIATGGPAVRVARGVAKALSPAAAQKRATEEAGRVIGRESLDADIIEEGARLEKEIPGYQETLAQSTQSPALARTQEKIEAKAQGPELEGYRARAVAEQRAIDTYATSKAPEGAPAEYVIDTASRRVENLREGVAVQQGKTAKRQRYLAEKLPETDRMATGETLRAKIHDLKNESSKRMSALADELGINNQKLGEGVHNRFRQILDDFKPTSAFEDVSKTSQPAVLDTIRKVLKSGKPIQFKDLKALRERLTDDLIDATSGASPNRKKVRSLVQMRKKVDGIVDDLASKSDAYRQFRDTYFKDHIQRFEKGAAFRIRQKDGRGFYRSQEEQVAKAFWGAGKVSDARQFKSIYAGDPEAAAIIKATALDDLRTAAVRDGMVDQNLLEAWVRRHRSVLDEFPEIDRSVNGIEAANKALAGRQKQLAGRAKMVENAILTKMVKRVEGATATPEKVIQDALDNPKRMSALLRGVGDNKAAHTALRRRLWDTIAHKPGNEIEAFILKYKKPLQQVLGGTHVNNLRTIQRARQRAEIIREPTGQGYQPNTFQNIEKLIGQRLPVLGSRVYALKTGRVQKGYLIIDAALKSAMGRERSSSEDLLKAALYDKSVAKELANSIHLRKMTPDVARRLNTRLFNLGLQSREDELSEPGGP